MISYSTFKNLINSFSYIVKGFGPKIKLFSIT